jgi:hypothetical protein
MPATNWETLLRKDICHIIQCLTNVSGGILYCLTSVGKRRKSVSSNVSNLVGNIFVFQEANFVSAIKANVSRCGRQGNI